MMDLLLPSHSFASNAEKRRYLFLLLGLYRWHLLLVALLAVPLSLAVQIGVFGEQRRFLFGFWIVASLLVTAFIVYLVRRSARGNWVARWRFMEPLWLLIWTAADQWRSRDALIYLRRQSGTTGMVAASPWILQLSVAIGLTLALQVPRFVPLMGWAILGPFGPHLSITESLVRRVEWIVKPPAYTGEGAQPAVPTQGKLTALPGSTLQMNVLSDSSSLLINASGELVRPFALTGEVSSFQFMVTGATEIRIEHRSAGLTVIDPQRFNIILETDEKPSIVWNAADPRDEIEEDDVWEFRLGATDQFGIARLGYLVADEAGHVVSDTISVDPPRPATENAWRLLPEAVLDRLETGMWTLIPVAWDSNPWRPEPAAGRAVTVTVVSRYDLHKRRLEKLQALFMYGVSLLADAWESKPIERNRAIADLQNLWRPIKAAEAEFWSAFGLAEVEQGVQAVERSLRAAIIDPLAVEEGVLHLMRGQALEQQSRVGDRLGAVERAEQDLMAALADASASDREILQMLAELQKKLQSLAATMNDKQQPLPQEMYNREAFSEENQNNSQKNLQDVLDALRSGDRSAARDMLKEFMKQIDEMRESMDQEKGPRQSAQGDGGESTGKGQSGGDNGQAGETQKTLREAQQALREAIAGEVQALEDGRKAGGTESGFSEADKQARAAGKKLAEVDERLAKLDEKLGGNLGGERQAVEDAGALWDKAGSQLRPGPDGIPVPVAEQTERLQKFNEEGEQSLRVLRQGLKDLQQKEQKLQQMQSRGGGHSQQKDENLKQQEQENQSARNRKRLFENFSSGVPETERNANQSYFHKLAK